MDKLEVPEADLFVEAAKDEIDNVEEVDFSTGGVFAREYDVYLKDGSIYRVSFEKIK